MRSTGGSSTAAATASSCGSRPTAATARQPKAIGSPSRPRIGGYTATSIAKGATASKDIKVSVEQAGGESPPDDEFKLVVLVDGKAVGDLRQRHHQARGDNNVATKVNAASKLINLEETNQGSALTPIAKGQVDLVRREPAPEPPSTDNLGAGDYVGDAGAAYRLRRPGGGRGGHHGRRTRPRRRARERRHRPRHLQGRAAGDDRALRADGRPDRDPRHPAGDERARGARVADP